MLVLMPILLATVTTNPIPIATDSFASPLRQMTTHRRLEFLPLPLATAPFATRIQSMAAAFVQTALKAVESRPRLRLKRTMEIRLMLVLPLPPRTLPLPTRISGAGASEPLARAVCWSMPTPMPSQCLRRSKYNMKKILVNETRHTAPRFSY
jgi:hypothetical protein